MVACKKCGADLGECICRDMAMDEYERESYWIRHYNSINNGYNTSKVGNINPDINQKMLTTNE